MNQSKFDTHSHLHTETYFLPLHAKTAVLSVFKSSSFHFVLKGDAIYFDPLYTKYVQQSFDIRNIFTYFHAISNPFNEVNIFF